MGKGNSLLVPKLNSMHWGNIYDPKMGAKILFVCEKRLSDSSILA